MRPDLHRKLFALAWTGFIILSLVSEPSTVPKFKWLAFEGVDKLIHAILFGVEAALVYGAFLGLQQFPRLLYVLLWCFVFGGVMEIIQHRCIQGRTGDWFDLVADMLGACIAMGAIKFIRR